MKVHGILLGSLVLMLLSPGAASAAPQGWYLGVGAGWSTLGSVKFDLGPPAGPTNGKVSFGDSAAVDFTMGYKFTPSIRAEVELKYADFSAHHLTPEGLPALDLSGDAAATSFMVNALYDIPLSRHFFFTVGLGAGAALFDPSITDAPLIRIGGSQTLFTWQAIAGFTVALSDRLEIQTDYRYQSFGNSDHTFTAVTNSPFTFKDKDIQSVMVNVRWYLEGLPKAEPLPPPPPPPAPPPPPPAPVKTFIVFFDFNKFDLSPEAIQVVAQAVKTAKSTGAVRVMVTGHTDTVGSESYNQTLSLKRASTVKGQMIADGLAEGEITTQGKGFHDPLVQTGPNVREPQNRRAVIDLGG